MKFNKFMLVLAAVGIVACATAVRAQDVYQTTRSVVLATPATLNTIGTATTTNNAIDVRAFTGKLLVNIFAVTNAGNATITATLETSDDKTNWVAIPNYAKAAATSVSSTNYWSGYSNVVVNTVLEPGSIVTPTAYSAGWSTPYMTPAQYTNSGAINVAANANALVAYPVEDGRQYLHVVWTQGGGASGTNVTVGASVTGLGMFHGW